MSYVRHLTAYHIPSPLPKFKLCHPDMLWFVQVATVHFIDYYVHHICHQLHNGALSKTDNSVCFWEILSTMFFKTFFYSFCANQHLFHSCNCTQIWTKYICWQQAPFYQKRTHIIIVYCVGAVVINVMCIF